MNKQFIVFCFLFLLNVCPWGSAAQNAATKTPQTWEEKNANQPFIYLLNEYKVRVNDDWSFTEETHYRIKIQKEAGKSLGEQQIYYNKGCEKIFNIEAFVETPDGQRHPFTKIQDLDAYQGAPMYSDMRLKVITLPTVSINSVIDVFVKSKTFRKSILNQFWDRIFYPLVPTKLGKTTFIFPKNKKIDLKNFNTTVEPFVKEDDKNIIYTFFFHETEDKQGRESFPPPYDEVYGFNSFSSLKDWKAIADWYRNLIVKNTVPDQAIAGKVEELIKDKKTQEEKALSILEFIQDNFRYVALSFGDNTVEPHRSADIFKNRYGDCKDWSILVKQMLRLAGIESNICLFSGEYDGDPQHGLPMVDAFDHVILEIFINGKSYFVDPQNKGYDIGEQPAQYDGTYLLVVENEGHRFDRIKPCPEEMNMMDASGHVYVKEDGSAEFDAQLILGLDASSGLRWMWQSAADEDKEKFLETFVAVVTKGGVLKEQKWDGLEARYGKVTCHLKFQRSFVYPVVNEMVILKEETLDQYENLFTEKERKQHIFYPNNTTIKSSTVYHIPEGFQIDFMPEDYALSNDFFQTSKSFKRNSQDNTFELLEIFGMRRVTFPRERYKEIKDFWTEYRKKESKYVVLKKAAQNLSQ